ncbi:hypothetical protein [Candidatus Accumulibacter aalborgensis]|uniref:hypothetical protein n=1 Tax=Candidatus Accumulibacter aalborgensis TaxID=1860102 RepID=UPI001648F017|nr:hypothetical protein [Candidatus Accumulibacter aalborgensis]
MTIQLAVGLLLVGAGVIFAGSMVIHAQQDRSDFLQVFFPVGDQYNEENSQRSASFENPESRLEFPMPRGLVDRVRIDPSNGAILTLLRGIEVKRLFGTETYETKDLLEYSTPIQMIGGFEASPGGLLVRSTGNDPAFELDLRRSPLLSQAVNFLVVNTILSFLLFVFLDKSWRRGVLAAMARLHFVLVPLAVALGISLLFYPGFMSHDSLHALRSAREGVTESEWPPMVSYVWRAVDLVSANPAAMHFSQVFLLLFSIYFIVLSFTRRAVGAGVFMVLYLGIPVILGTVGVIWKDVLMAGFFLAGFAVVVVMSRLGHGSGFIPLFALAICLIYVAVCSRHNAITAAVPILFYLSLVACSRLKPRGAWFGYGVLFLCSALTGGLFLAKTVLDKYSLPGLEKMRDHTSTFIGTVRVFDIAGASLCTGANLFGEMAPEWSVVDIGKLYDPRHTNLSRGLWDRVGSDRRIDRTWLNVAAQHPLCFLHHKLQLSKYLVGANEGDQFLITHPSIDENEYGYVLPASSLRDAVVTYVVEASQVVLLRPWFIYMLAIGALFYMCRVRALTVGSLTLFLSGGFYFGGLVVFGNAADARLLFYTTTALSIFVFIAVMKFIERLR